MKTKQISKRIISLILTFALVLGELTLPFAPGSMEVQASDPIDPITYIDADGTLKTCSSYTIVRTLWNEWSNGWYVVRGDYDMADSVTVSGEVHLILCNGVTLTVDKGIRVESNASLSIYAQSDDENVMGALVATTDFDQDNGCAGIGGARDGDAGTITINGGKITARGNYAAGIGSGRSGSVGTITINDGIIDAEDSLGNAAGIGSGYEGKAGIINLNGGTIHARGIGSGYQGGECNITVNISDGIKEIVATPTFGGGSCIGMGRGANGSASVRFLHEGNEVSAEAKESLFYDSGEGSSRKIRGGAQHAILRSMMISRQVSRQICYRLLRGTRSRLHLERPFLHRHCG